MDIKQILTDTSITRYRIDKENRTCEILDDDDNCIFAFDTVIEIDDEYDWHNYDVIIMYNNRQDCSEESIYQVRVKGNRVGWIFPIQAIHSTDHSMADNSYFLKYAYVAWCYLLEKCSCEVDDIEQFDLFGCYKSYTNLLVLDKENCRENDFLYERYVVSLFAKGYSECGEGNVFAEQITHTKHLNVLPQSELLEEVPYIYELFRYRIPQERNAVSRFYLYYQIVEILITVVFNHLFEKFIGGLKIRTDDLFDKKEDLMRYANEKERLKQLCNGYSRIETALKTDINVKCEELLSYTSSKKGENMSDNLYFVRCLLVHRMYVLDAHAESILEDIDDMFLDLCIQLLLSFHLPEENGTDLEEMV